MKHYVYLAGPIAGQTYDSATDWRYKASKEIDSDKVECLSPMRGKSHLKGVAVLSSGGYEHNAMSTEKGINRRDFFDCTRAECLLVNFLDCGSRVSIGTVMEIAWAYQAKIPTVVVMKMNNAHVHAMINDCITYRVETMEEAVRLVKFLFNDLK
jgi:nucleoside 2-deoxyribosyltransferase